MGVKYLDFTQDGEPKLSLIGKDVMAAAGLYIEDGSVGLGLRDSKGRTIALNAGDTSTGLLMQDETSLYQAGLMMTREGGQVLISSPVNKLLLDHTENQFGLAFFHALADNPMMLLSRNDEGQAFLHFNNPFGRKILSVVAGTEMAGVTVWNPLNNSETLGGFTMSDGEGGFYIKDITGKVVWSAP